MIVAAHVMTDCMNTGYIEARVSCFAVAKDSALFAGR